MIEVEEYVDPDGRSLFADWFGRVDRSAKVRIAAAIEKIERGNVAILKSVGTGVFEIRIDSGPGYRIYCGRDGDVLLLLLTGGTKKRQQEDIETARSLWNEYKARKIQKADRLPKTGTKA